MFPIDMIILRSSEVRFPEAVPSPNSLSPNGRQQRPTIVSTLDQYQTASHKENGERWLCPTRWSLVLRRSPGGEAAFQEELQSRPADLLSLDRPAEPILAMSDVPSTSEGAPVPSQTSAPASAAPKQEKEKAKKVANTSKRGRNQAKGLIEVEPVMGTRDFYPEDMRVRNWLFDNFRQIAKAFCFQVRHMRRLNSRLPSPCFPLLPSSPFLYVSLAASPLIVTDNRLRLLVMTWSMM